MWVESHFFTWKLLRPCCFALLPAHKQILMLLIFRITCSTVVVCCPWQSGWVYPTMSDPKSRFAFILLKYSIFMKYSIQCLTKANLSDPRLHSTWIYCKCFYCSILLYNVMHLIEFQNWTLWASLLLYSSLISLYWPLYS